MTINPITVRMTTTTKPPQQQQIQERRTQSPRHIPNQGPHKVLAERTRPSEPEQLAAQPVQTGRQTGLYGQSLRGILEFRGVYLSSRRTACCNPPIAAGASPRSPPVTTPIRKPWPRTVHWQAGRDKREKERDRRKNGRKEEG